MVSWSFRDNKNQLPSKKAFLLKRTCFGIMTNKCMTPPSPPSLFALFVEPPLMISNLGVCYKKAPSSSQPYQKNVSAIVENNIYIYIICTQFSRIKKRGK